ncbi:MAG: hypothetical protein WCA32_00750 [Chromatiaceae bacterium]
MSRWSRGYRRAAQWLAVLSFLLSVGAAADDACVKRVFGAYCLGGDINAMHHQGLPPLFQETDGERRAVVFSEGPKKIYVLAFRNRIYKVVRQYQIATQLRYDDLYNLLRRKYGPGEDRSQFPPYATSPARRLGSIRRGDGRAVHYWKPAESWHIELSWTREMGLALAYIDTGLDEQREAAMERGL